MGELVSIKIRKNLLGALDLIKREKKLRSMSDAIEYLINLYASSDIKIASLLQEIKEKLIQIEHLVGGKKVVEKGGKEVVKSEKLPPSYHQETTTKSGNTTSLPPEEEKVTTELPPSDLDISAIGIIDATLRKTLTDIAKEATQYEYDYELVSLGGNTWALILGPYLTARFKIGDKEFRLSEIMRRTMWIRHNNMLVLAFKAPTTIHIDILHGKKVIAQLKA